MSVCAAKTAAGTNPAGLTPEEEHRKLELQNRLCADRELSCIYVTAILTDSRLTIYLPPEPAGPPPAPAPKDHERNPYLTKRFGLRTSESMERCKEFVQTHLLAFNAAYQLYGVPREDICGHLRIETNFGIPTKTVAKSIGHDSCDRSARHIVRSQIRSQTATGSFPHDLHERVGTPLRNANLIIVSVLRVNLLEWAESPYT
jgi:hypothetical protein